MYRRIATTSSSILQAMGWHVFVGKWLGAQPSQGCGIVNGSWINMDFQLIIMIITVMIWVWAKPCCHLKPVPLRQVNCQSRGTLVVLRSNLSIPRDPTRQFGAHRILHELSQLILKRLARLAACMNTCENIWKQIWKHISWRLYYIQILLSGHLHGCLHGNWTCFPIECLVCGSVVFGKAFYLLSASFSVVKVWPLLRDQLCAFSPRWECTLPSNINQLLWQSDKAGGIDSPIHIFNSWHPRQLTKQETITCLVLPNRLTSWIIVICLEPLRFNLQ